jgi:hypothetical protein
MASSQWFERFFSYFSFVSSPNSDSLTTRSSNSRLRLESLEDRAVPAIFTVTTLNDSGAGSLRQAILDANVSPDADTVVFQSGLTGTINLSTVGDTSNGNSALNVSTAITIDGTNTLDLTIARSSDASTPKMRLINVTQSGNLTLQGVALKGGEAQGNIRTTADATDVHGLGGAIYNSGTLAIWNSYIGGNKAQGGAGSTEAGLDAAGDGLGGAIYNNAGTVVIRNSTLSENTALGGSGPADNNGNGQGGAIFNRNGSLDVSNSTITQNNVSSNLVADGRGRGIYNLGDGATATAHIESTIIGQSDTNAIDFVGEARNGGTNTTSGSHNLIRRAIGYSGEVTSTLDPLLDLLRGTGRSLSYGLLEDSPAIDSGSNTHQLTNDQRGEVLERTFGSATDIGAFEAQSMDDLPPIDPPVDPPKTPTQPPIHVVGAGKGGSPHVKVLNQDGSEKLSFLAYDEFFAGGVNVAQGDVNKDGVKDVITAPLSGGSPHIKVFDGKTGALIHSFYAYDESLATGVNIASGDVNGDGYDDIVTVPRTGAVSHVRVFDGRTGQSIRSFYAYDPSFTGGASLAVTDYDKDGRADIITGAGVGGMPHVRGFSGKDSFEILSFFANGYFSSFGITVAAGDMNGDGQQDILATAMTGNTAMVEVNDGKTLNMVNNFFPVGSDPTGTITLATQDINGDGKDEVIVGATKGTAPKIKVLNPAKNFSEMQVLSAFGSSFLGGVIVG